jgi:hypothetical protein
MYAVYRNNQIWVTPYKTRKTALHAVDYYAAEEAPNVVWSIKSIGGERATNKEIAICSVPVGRGDLRSRQAMRVFSWATIAVVAISLICAAIVSLRISSDIAHIEATSERISSEIDKVSAQADAIKRQLMLLEEQSK